jgi:hypothetical protein
MSSLLHHWSLLGFVFAALAAEPRLDRYGDPLPAHASVRLGTLRLRPAKPVGTFALSPDGKTLATAEPWRIRLWDMKTGQQRHEVAVRAGWTDSPDRDQLPWAHTQPPSN